MTVDGAAKATGSWNPAMLTSGKRRWTVRMVLLLSTFAMSTYTAKRSRRPLMLKTLSTRRSRMFSGSTRRLPRGWRRGWRPDEDGGKLNWLEAQRWNAEEVRPL